MQKSQEEFAEMAGMSVDFLSLIERGRNAPSFKKLERMSKGLQMPVASFFTFEAIESTTKIKRAKISEKSGTFSARRSRKNPSRLH
jgi:transcriptional regulator with XRE-family HTH domain